MGARGAARKGAVAHSLAEPGADARGATLPEQRAHEHDSAPWQKMATKYEMSTESSFKSAEEVKDKNLEALGASGIHGCTSLVVAAYASLPEVVQVLRTPRHHAQALFSPKHSAANSPHASHGCLLLCWQLLLAAAAV